jgi:cell division protein FtsZ
MVSSLVNMLNYSKGISMNAFDSLRSLFRSNKEMFFGCGAVMGEFQAVSALRHAIKSDLLITSLSNANRILLTIDYKEEISKETLDLLYDEIYNITGDDVDIIYTSSINPESMGILFVSVFATGEDIKDNNKSISDFDKLKDAINPNNFL